MIIKKEDASIILLQQKNMAVNLPGSAGLTVLPTLGQNVSWRPLPLQQMDHFSN